MLPYFIQWYYGRAPRRLFALWIGTVRFFVHYFSLPQLLSTLVSPWKRDITRSSRGFSFRAFFHTLAWNLISRAIGMVIRGAVILLGSAVALLTLVGGGVVYVLWFILPFLVFLGVVTGFVLLIT